jgi:hypothetical protein
MKKEELPELLYLLLIEMGGKAKLIDIFKAFYSKYESQLKKSGDLYYTWNYEIRWAATKLRKENRMVNAKEQKKGIWEIIN